MSNLDVKTECDNTTKRVANALTAIDSGKVQHLILNAENITIVSTTISNVFGRPHKNVLAILDNLIADNTISRLEFKPRNYTKRGRTYRCYELNEAGFLKAMPFIGGRKSKEGQKMLVDEFMRMKKLLAKQSKIRESEAFQLIRSEGKDTRKLLADTIQTFIDYALLNGSTNAKRYYKIITNLIYKSFLEVGQNANKIRDLLTPIQLSELQTAELIAVDTLTKGMENKLPYKNIYKQLQNQLSVFTSSKTKLLGD